MAEHAFETVDVFTGRRFGGTPLAVFRDARGVSNAECHLPGYGPRSEITFAIAWARITRRCR